MPAPLVCTRCGGAGWITFDAYGDDHAQRVKCPVCDGAMLVWPDGSDALRDRVQAVKAERNGGPPAGPPADELKAELERIRDPENHRPKLKMYERLICTDCDPPQLVAMNWAARHAKTVHGKGPQRV